jgi:polyhydroxybutyrate depolymerase
VTPTGKTTTATIHTPDGRDRTYHLYVPPTLPAGQAVPLLVAMHGGTGWATQFEAQSGFDGLAQANDFIVAYPDGITLPNLGHGEVWNVGHCCGAASQDAENVDDVGFISTMIDQIEASHDIDKSRVYAAGHSNGAMMGIRLGCELSDKIVAVGVQSGTLELDQCQPSQKVSLLEIHGTADKNVPIDGGKGTAGISQADFRPPKNAIDAYVKANDCPADPTTAVDPSNPDVTTDTWSPCAAGTEVQWMKVAGAPHAWMGHPADPGVAERGGVPYQKLDSSLVIWTFLAAHPRQ